VFCILEKDQKTFSYFRRFAQCFETGASCLEVDNTIQAEEMAAHLAANNLSPGDTAAKLDWVARNGHSFRNYLNTIKLVYVLCKATGKDPLLLDEEAFTTLEDRVNGLRDCLTTMYE